MKLFRYIIFLLAVFIIFLVLITVFIHPYLSVNNPIVSKNLVIEAWLSGHELETIIENSKPYDLETIFVVGKKFENDTKKNTKLTDFENDEFFRWRGKAGVLLLTNSTLLVDLSKLTNGQPGSNQTIIVKTCDTQLNNLFAHFNVALNGVWLGDSFADDSLKEYSFRANVDGSENHMLSIYFDNDYQSKDESRNLYIESVQVNGLGYIVDETNSIITRHESLMTTGFDSEAAQTTQYLKALNVNPKIIKVIEFNINGENQTLTTALQLKAHLIKSLPEDLNVSSAGLHARRTLLTYRKVLEIDRLGIINVQVKKFDRNNWYKTTSGIQKMMDELFSYIVIWLKLTFAY